MYARIKLEKKFSKAGPLTFQDIYDLCLDNNNNNNNKILNA